MQIAFSHPSLCLIPQVLAHSFNNGDVGYQPLIAANVFAKAKDKKNLKYKSLSDHVELTRVWQSGLSWLLDYVILQKIHQCTHF